MRSPPGLRLLALAAIAAGGCGRSMLLGDFGSCAPGSPGCSAPGGDGGFTDDGFTDDGFADGGFTGDGFPGGDGLTLGDGSTDDGFGTGDGFGGDGLLGDGGGDGPMDLGAVDMAGDGAPDLTGCDNVALDCTQPIVQAIPACIDKLHENCTNGIDDDANGYVDCADPQCFGDRACFVPGQEVCNNSLNDDDTGLADCANPSCLSSLACMQHAGTEVCDNGVDDNGDRLVDCADPQCVKFPACLRAACNADLDFGVIAPHGARVTRAFTTVGSCASYRTCAPGGAARVAGFQLIDVTDLELSFAQARGSAHVVALDAAGVLQGCDLNPIDCLQAGQLPSATRSYAALRPGFYWLIVQSYPGTEGSVTLTLSTGGVPTGTDGFIPPGTDGFIPPGTDGFIPPGTDGFIPPGNDGFIPPGNDGFIPPGNDGFTPPGDDGGLSDDSGVPPGGDGGLSNPDLGAHCGPKEICNNGVDDDCNGLTDCADHACFNDPNCAGKECGYDINLGAIIVGAPPKEARFDTRQSQDRYHPTCAGTSTGNDEVVRFTLKQPAGILVQWTQGGDHVFGLFRTPPPGQACDAFQQSCYWPGGGKSGTVAWQVRPAGDYLFILKAVKAGGDGPMDLLISAFKERPVEICNNGIDDDGNGLTDCQDPACFGVGNCKAPLCMPDVDLGDFFWGTQKSVTLDTTTGQHIYQAKCAQGGGLERVVRISIDQPMALGISCNGTGDHVIQLAEQVQPLDLCDANKLVCSDPKVLPFGCNYAVPNLQPGKYNIIVQAFAGGDEGVVNLTLSGIRENVMIDCSQMGACADLRCVTSPSCQQFQCRADQKLGLLPLDGRTTSTVVQTSNRMALAMGAPCLAVPGGKEAVVDFEMPGQGDLTIEWAQVGNHDFALYVNQNDLLGCQDGVLVDCHSSGGMATGKYMLSKLAGKKYHLLVDADQPGAEGGVILQFFGMPNP